MAQRAFAKYGAKAVVIKIDKKFTYMAVSSVSLVGMLLYRKQKGKKGEPQRTW
jgi:hypothetical protein